MVLVFEGQCGPEDGDYRVKIEQILGCDQDGETVKSSATCIDVVDNSLQKTSRYLVDCGSPRFVEALMAGLEKQGKCDELYVILTHTHFDHCAGLNRLENVKQVVTIDDFGSNLLLTLIKDVLVAVKTPGHSNNDISVVCFFQGKTVVVAGDIFEDVDDQETESWKPQSHNCIIQEISRKFLWGFADVIVPGHGKWFEKKFGKFGRLDCFFKKPTSRIQMEFLGEKGKCPAVCRFEDGEIVCIDGQTDGKTLEGLDGGPKIVVFLGTGTFQTALPFDPVRVYMETDIYSKGVGHSVEGGVEETYGSMEECGSTMIGTESWSDVAAIWRMPGPGGLIFPVFCYFDKFGCVKFIHGSSPGVATDSDRDLLRKMLLANVDVKYPGIV